LCPLEGKKRRSDLSVLGSPGKAATWLFMLYVTRGLLWWRSDEVKPSRRGVWVCTVKPGDARALRGGDGAACTRLRGSAFSRSPHQDVAELPGIVAIDVLWRKLAGVIVQVRPVGIAAFDWPG